MALSHPHLGLLAAAIALGSCGGDGGGGEGTAPAREEAAEPALVEVAVLCRAAGRKTVNVHRHVPLRAYGELGVGGDERNYPGRPHWRRVPCRDLGVFGRIDDADFPPADQPGFGNEWLRVRSADGSVDGWLENPIGPGSRPVGERVADIIWNLPGSDARPEHPRGRPDLALARLRPTSKPGDPCFPGDDAPREVRFSSYIANVGAGTWRPKLIEVRRRDGVERYRFNRGLEPGERYDLGVGPAETVVLDPRNRVREQSERNNSATAGSLPSLVCRRR